MKNPIVCQNPQGIAESERFGTQLQVAGTKDEVMKMLREVTSLVKTAGDLGFKVRKLLSRLDFTYDQVRRENARLNGEGMSFFSNNMSFFT